MLQAKLQEYLQLTENQINNFLDKYQPNVESLYQPIDYALKGGKKIRLASVLLGADIFEGNLKEATYAAASIELFHNFTLLHDDVMDKSLVRRNRPTVQAKWNPNQAILSGDAIMVLVYNKLLLLNDKLLRPVMKLLNKTALEVCEGQQLDMEFETRSDIQLDEYLEMIRLKTAVLLAASLAVGAMIAGTSDENIENLYNFGINLGLAFQIQDDYFDTFGNFETFGKRIGNDIVTNKKTFLIIKALELANDEQRAELMRLYGSDDFEEQQKIKRVTDIFKSLNIDKIALKQVEEYYSEALKFLEKLNDIAQNKRQLLYQYAEYLLKRKK